MILVIQTIQQSTRPRIRGDENGGTLPTANKYLFADLLISLSGEVDKATSFSFATRYAPIEASSASLEALIAA